MGFELSFDAVEDLNELGVEAAWSVVKALADYYRGGVFPHHFTGEQKLCFVAILERRQRRA